MWFPVEQAFVGRDEKRASLKTPAWEATVPPHMSSSLSDREGEGGGGEGVFGAPLRKKVNDFKTVQAVTTKHSDFS